MKRPRKVHNVHVEVQFKQKERLTIAFAGSTPPDRKPSHKGTKDFIVDKIACHQHAALLKLNSPTAPPPRNHNK